MSPHINYPPTQLYICQEHMWTLLYTSKICAVQEYYHNVVLQIQENVCKLLPSPKLIPCVHKNLNEDLHSFNNCHFVNPLNLFQLAIPLIAVD